MKTWIVLFRGINVGGNNLLPMKELSEILAGVGCSDVRTYIQSGNVVFTMGGTTAARLSKLIGAAVLKRKGFAPKILLLSVQDFEQALASNPLTAAEAIPKSLHLFFLSEEPDPATLNALEPIKSDSEDFALSGRVFYLHTPDGLGRSKLAANVEKKLGVDATARNWRTASKLREMARQAN